MSLPGASVVKDLSPLQETLVDPWVRRSPREGNGNPLQYSCLENPMDREAWWLQSKGSQRVRHDLVTKLPKRFLKSELPFILVRVWYLSNSFLCLLFQIILWNSTQSDKKVSPEKWNISCRISRDLWDLQELTPEKDVLYIIGEWNAKVGSQEIPGVTGKFGLGIQNEAGWRLTEFCQENALVTANTLFQQHKIWTSLDGQYWN